MAAIDFPASPVNGQVFAAPNGVTYIYSSTYTAWQAQPLSAGFVGDFMATNSAQINVGAATVQAILNTVITGNSGGWYNPATGRYTPPKGRYYVSFTPGVMGSSTGATTAQTYLRKNGVQVATAFQVPGTANWYGDPEAHGIFDCNGTDYFEVFVQCNQAQAAIALTSAVFLAFPVSPNANMVQGTGDFQATQSANFALPQNTGTTLVWNTIVAGNSGGWYSTANGRYTPPAGRYKLTAFLSGLSTSGQFMQVIIRKNGTQISPQGNTNGGASLWSEAYAEVIADANGTDWFDSQGYTGGTGTQFNGGFAAFPISGIKGPQGDPGAVGQAGANAWNVRATANDTLSGANIINLFRTGFANPTKDYDPDNVIDVATNARFTAPNAGRYHFECHAFLQPSAATECSLVMRHMTNAGASIRNYVHMQRCDNNNYASAFTVSLDLQMAAGERVDWVFGQNGGGSVIAYAQAGITPVTGQATYASGHRIN